MMKVFTYWGIDSSLIYQDKISMSGRLQKILASLRFGKEVMALFSKATVEIPPCDFLVLDNFRYLHWNLKFANKCPRPRLIYNAHNLEFENYFGKNGHSRRDKFAMYEAKKMDLCDLIFVCSEREQNILFDLNPALEGKIHVFPNLVDANHYLSKPSKKWITFLGSLDYFPNIEAVRFLANQFIKDLDPKLREFLIIAGRNPTDEVKRLCSLSGIELRTNLSDREVTELLAETKVSLVPLVSGSGTRLKIVESLFSHAMVLSTPVGAEGVDLAGLCINSLDAFSKDCSELYNKNSFSQYCPTSLYNKYLESYDCYTWAELNKHKFQEILISRMP